MKVCPSCGSELADELSFCPSDGSPLLSEEEPESDIGEKTVVMSDETDVGEKTVVMPDAGDATVMMGHDEFDEEETVVPDRPAETEEGVGDATLVMPEGSLPDSGTDVPASPPGEFVTEDVPSTPDDTMYASADDEADSGDTSEWAAPAAGPTDEWTEETGASDDDFAATAASDDEWEEEAADDFESTAASAGDWEEAESDHEGSAEGDEAPAVAAAAPVAESGGEGKKSYVGLIIGLVLLFFAFIVILGAAGGIWWYLSNRPAETAATNTEANVDENLATPEEEVPFEDLNSNLDDASNVDANASPSPGQSPANTNQRATPTPRATRSPSPSPGSTVEITRPTPGRTPTPTPARTPTPVRTTPTPNIPSRVSRGVINGQAVSLPQPAYPAAARAVNARGRVTVAVVIDRQGRVISANAVSGHPLLRGPAESAARRARFRPTLLSGQPVEVSGSIVYNFQ